MTDVLNVLAGIATWVLYGFAVVALAALGQRLCRRIQRGIELERRMLESRRAWEQERKLAQLEDEHLPQWERELENK